MYVFFPTFTLYDVAPVTFFQVIFNVPFFLLAALIPLTLASFLTVTFAVGLTVGFCVGCAGLTDGCVGLTDGCVGLTDGFVSGSVNSGFTPLSVIVKSLTTTVPFQLASVSVMISLTSFPA